MYLPTTQKQDLPIDFQLECVIGIDDLSHIRHVIAQLNSMSMPADP